MIRAAFQYLFGALPPQDVQQTAQRATLQQFQTYPANEIEGSGTLVTQNGITGGKYWQITQPPQVFVDHTAPLGDLLDGGTMAGGFYGAPLVDNPNTGSIS